MWVREAVGEEMSRGMGNLGVGEGTNFWEWIWRQQH